jgi:hypothetical protein
MGDFKLPCRMQGIRRDCGHSGARDLASPETEQTARGCLLLIGSALARSRGWHVRAMFDIEDFCGKSNGGRML